MLVLSEVVVVLSVDEFDSDVLSSPQADRARARTRERVPVWPSLMRPSDFLPDVGSRKIRVGRSS
jgi:hypothetical protein